jgi:hypothetical protein
MPVGLRPVVASKNKNPKSVAISASYPNLSTSCFRQNPPVAAVYLPNERRLISARPSQSPAGLNWITPHLSRPQLQTVHGFYEFLAARLYTMCYEDREHKC